MRDLANLRNIMLVCCSLVLISPSPLRAQDNNNQAAVESLRGFVQNFYDWYVPKALKAKAPGPAWAIAVKDKKSAFTPQLSQALKDDSDAQDKSPGEIVGLDFDPFLNSQDPAHHYQVGDVVLKGETYWINIHRVSGAKKRVKPDIVAELMYKDGNCMFVNFHYKDGGNLVTILNALRAERK